MIRLSFIMIAMGMAIATYGQNVKSAKGEDFGSGISAKKYMAMTEVMERVQTSGEEGAEVTMRATVNEVCQAKGCWMTLSSESQEQEFMVKFKDYGFFVPKDISGKEVLVEGVAFITEVPVDELRHYAEDAGKSAEEIALIQEPEVKLSFTATGVRVLK